MYLSEMQPGPKTDPPRNVSSKELDLLSQIVEKRLGMDLDLRKRLGMTSKGREWLGFKSRAFLSV